jgi:CO/xanthine dehydrogenase Mo-binding subunit
VEAGQPLAMVHARTQEAAEQAIREIQAAYQIADAAPAPTRSSIAPFAHDLRVAPAQAGPILSMDSRLRGNDGWRS